MQDSTFYIKLSAPAAAFRWKQAAQLLVGKAMGVSSMTKERLLSSTSKGMV